jgi:butyryl-CoA dehydrogenase
MRSFDGKVAVVTGAASGIGRELAWQLASRGADVAITDVDAEGLAVTAKGMPALQRVTRHLFDVSDPAAYAAFADEAIATHGLVDIVVNNAGMLSRYASFTELTPEEFERYFAVNFWGAVYGARAFLPHLLTRPEATLVNVSSMYGFIATPLQSPYIASKAAVRGFTEALRYELLRSNVHVMCVFPGVVKSGLGAHTPALSEEERQANIRVQETYSRTTPAEAAAQMISGMEKRKARCIIGSDGRLTDFVARLIPGSYPKLFFPLIRRLEPRLGEAVDRLAHD